MISNNQIKNIFQKDLNEFDQMQTMSTPIFLPHLQKINEYNLENLQNQHKQEPNTQNRSQRRLSDWVDMGSSHSHDPADERTSIESNNKKRDIKLDNKIQPQQQNQEKASAFTPLQRSFIPRKNTEDNLIGMKRIQETIKPYVNNQQIIQQLRQLANSQIIQLQEQNNKILLQNQTILQDQNLLLDHPLKRDRSNSNY